MSRINGTGRIIEFKAKKACNPGKGEWVYGSLIMEGCAIPWIAFDNINGEMEQVLVDGSTVCQFTGRNDSKHWRLYEGDIIYIPHCNMRYAEIIYEHCQFKVHHRDGLGLSFPLWDFVQDHKDTGWRIVGNIHDNPYVGGKYTGIKEPKEH